MDATTTSTPPKLDIPIMGVEQVDDRIWLKRDDLYQPFDDVTLNGAKVYQCMSLLHGCYDRIMSDNDGTVFTDSFVISPQGPIVARVAQYMGMKSIVCVGSKTAEYAAEHHPAIRMSKSFGSHIDCVCGPGASMSLGVFARRKYADKYFHVAFGMNATDDRTRGLVLDPLSRQVEAFRDLPTETMTLVVPGGSCVAFTGLLLGLARSGIKFKRIVSVQIAGYDRTNRIKAMVGDREVPEYEHIVDHTYPYSRKVKRQVGDVVLDSGYEAKAWAWVEREVDPSERVLFYIVGNSNITRV